MIKKKKEKEYEGGEMAGCVCGTSPEEGKGKEKRRRKREGTESRGKQTGQLWASMLGRFSFIFFLFFLSYTPASDPTLTLV